MYFLSMKKDIADKLSNANHNFEQPLSCVVKNKHIKLVSILHNNYVKCLYFRINKVHKTVHSFIKLS